MADPIETEVKLRVADEDVVRKRLREIGAALVRPRYFEDNVFLDDAERSLMASGHALRLRRTPEGGVLTYKGQAPTAEGLKQRVEVEAPVPDPDALEDVLGRLGYQRAFRYQKYRETYGWEGVEVVIDETPIGSFLEIEGEAEGIHRAAAALGFERKDYIAETYIDLFLSGGGQGDMVF